MNATDATGQEDYGYNTFVAIVIFLVGIFGVAWNVLAIICVMKNPVLKNSFGLLCTSHCLANLGVLTVFIVWCGPVTALQQDELAETILGKRLGQINIFFWDCCVYSHLAISINRLITMSFPNKASNLLSIKKTIVILIIVWFLGACHATPYWWSDDCYIVYSAITWTWDFADTECGYIISIYFDYYTGVGVFIAIMCMDMTTFFQMRQLNKAASSGQNGSFKSNRRRVEQRFFIQTVIQGSIFFYELLNFYWLYTLSKDSLYIYFTTTFAWEICHALDGLVVLTFHYRGAFFRPTNNSLLVSRSKTSMTQV